MTGKKIFQSAIILILLLGAPVAAFAQNGLNVDVTTTVYCDNVDFDFDLLEGFGPYTFRLEFGDTEVFEAFDQPAGSFKVNHPYPHGGGFNWKLMVAGSGDVLGEVEGTVTIDGPVVILNSDPMPPLLTIESGAASILFKAEVSGGVGPYIYTWDLDEDGLPDPGLSDKNAPYTYSTGGKHPATVWVSDSCDRSHTDTLTVVVVDPEEDPGDACHPTAKKIADAVNSLLPYRADDTYTCEDIFDIFEGALTGNHTGFGRLWHAYQLTQTIPDLTWEEMRDWSLDGSGWGALTQLNRFADTLDEFGIRELFDLVVNGDNTVGEIRTAARAAVRYEADFEDALTRVSEGANPGELGQFYKLAAEMEVDTETLDQYLADGMSLSELSHAAKMSERAEVEWADVIEAKASGHSWGDIGQAYKLADDVTSVAEILNMGVQEFRADQRDVEKLAREEERKAREDAHTAARKEGLDEKTAARFSEQYGVTLGELNSFFEDCDSSWSCVRKELKKKDQAQVEGVSDKNTRTAERLAAQYGVGIENVWVKFNTGDCAGDWNCVRAELRDMTKKDK